MRAAGFCWRDRTKRGEAEVSTWSPIISQLAEGRRPQKIPHSYNSSCNAGTERLSHCALRHVGNFVFLKASLPAQECVLISSHEVTDHFRYKDHTSPKHP